MKKITILIFSVLLLISCDDPNKDNMLPPLEVLPIGTYLEQNPEEFSEWAALLKHANLNTTMNLNATYTAFVPTNEAVGKYLSENGYASVEAIPKDEAELLVKYHTIKGKAYTQNDLSAGLLNDTTVSGDYLSIEYKESVYVNGIARIKDLDLKVSNGSLHSIEAVLPPVWATIWDKINSTEYSIMAKAIELTGYSEQLSALRDGTKKIRYTLFVVPNSVFKDNEIDDVDDLISTIGADADYTNTENALNKYVAYHIFNQQWDVSQLLKFTGTNYTKNISPIAEGELVNVSIQGMRMYINYRAEDETGISITEPNVNTKNGILHVLDDPMFVYVPDMASVIWELTDYTELSRITNYRKSGLKTTSQTYLEADKYTSYKWETATADRMNTSVRYNAFQTTDVRYAFINYDGLELSLRLYGWIEMKSPTIVKGKYKVNLFHYSASASSQGGKITVSLDDNFIGGEVALNGFSSTTPRVDTTTLGTIEFETTTSHTLRILQTDTQTIFLDYIEFVPVD